MRTQFLNEGIGEWLKTSRKGVPVELVPWEFHHYRFLTAGAVPVENTYFNIAAGQVISGGSVATKEDCNLFKASSIGYPYKFLVQEVGFMVTPTTATIEKLAEADFAKAVQNDMNLLLARGVLSFETLQKTYFELSPKYQAPAGIGLVGSVAVAGDIAAPGAYVGGALTNGWAVKSNRFHCEIPLDEETSFNIYDRYPRGAITLVSGATFAVGPIIAGILQRPKV